MQSDDDDDVYSTAISSLVSDLLGYGLAIEANSNTGIYFALNCPKIVNNLICKGYGSEGMKTPF
jgi:hypothetical protein